ADRAAAAKWADVVEAALNGDLPAVRGFVRQNRAAALSATNQKFGETALLWAAWQNHDDVVHFLIEAKADLDVANNDGRTALRWAARCGCLRSAGLLVAAGASLDVKDGDGETPLDDARSQGHDNVVKLLESA
ncbi:Ankyrin repeat domain-containing protein 39, partial [Durusdinium trenchii]